LLRVLTLTIALCGQIAYVYDCMATNQHCRLLFFTALVAASSALPAFAAELRFPSPHNTVAVLSAKKKPALPRNIEIVSVEPSTRSQRALEYCIPIILGVAY
jgi:hypothetical protein